MSKNIKPSYVTSPSYRQEHTLGYKVVMGSTALIVVMALWAAIVWVG